MWRNRAVRSRGGLAWVVAAFAVLILLVMTLYQVQPEEVGVVVRLGQYVRTTEPGLRVKIPFVEQVFKVPVQRQLKEEFGFRTEEAGVRTHTSATTSSRRVADADRRPQRGGRRVDAQYRVAIRTSTCSRCEIRTRRSVP